MDADDFEKIEEMFKHHVGVASDNFKHHVGVLSEDFQSWCIDAVAVDLSAHRADTEAHHGVYRVREEYIMSDVISVFPGGRRMLNHWSHWG